MTVLPASALAVRDLIRRRAAEHSQPGARRDPHRLALCVEGGAMRGVVSAGMVAALEQLGLLPVFDRVYGSSAGAMNAAYFLAGQAALGTTIYYENINNTAFIDLGRVLRRRPIVDLDFLVWDVMRRAKRLDTSKVMHSPVGLVAIATDTASGHGVTFDSWSTGDDLLGCLRAGSTMPIVAGPPYPYRGGAYWDALLVEPIPAPTAEEDGYSHLLVLLTRPVGAPGPKLSVADRVLILPRLRAVSDTLASRYVARARHYAELLRALDSGRGPTGRASALAIAPAAGAISKLERDRERLMEGAQAGMQAVVDVLGSALDHITTR